MKATRYTGRQAARSVRVRSAAWAGTLAVRAVTAALLVVSPVGGGAAFGQRVDDDSPTRLSPAEIEALYRARTDSARLRFTAADVEFVTGMISHHRQALDMADLAPSHGASAAVRRLAARIINGQRDEIALMQRWLEDRGQPVPASVGALVAHAHMPGMLSPEQMRQLDASRGAEFDRLFLACMIHHHAGAVTIVRDLFRRDGAGHETAIFKLASDIQADQTTEIARMQRMLDALGDPTLTRSRSTRGP